MNTSWITLYKLSHSGSIQEWAIKVQDWQIIIGYGQQGGAIQYQTEDVPEGLGGRSRREQVISRVRSRISKQKDKGYKENIILAQEEKGRDASGNLKPMLAMPIRKVNSSSIDWSSAFVQYKYDGHRCLTIAQDRWSYSRGGKPITSISHIHDDLGGVVAHLDGELYKHGEALQTLASWIKRDQPKTKELSYVIYDLLLPIPFKDRLSILSQLNFGPSVQVAPTFKVPSMAAVMEYFDQALSEGYEGAILRQGSHSYEVNKRSNSLIKLKPVYFEEYREEDEVTVDKIRRSRDGWAILDCITKDGRRLSVSAPGTVKDKVEVLVNADKYLGKQVTIEYSQKTEGGVPFHAVAVRFREDI